VGAGDTKSLKGGIIYEEKDCGYTGSFDIGDLFIQQCLGSGRNQNWI
jgi:hypothetical protein